MFGFKSIVKYVAVVAAALTMIACGDEAKKSSLASEGNMIPDNAMMAMKIDVAQLFDKALGAPGSDVRKAWGMAKSLVPMYASQMGEIGTLASEVFTDPAALGIRLDEPVVISCTAEVTNFAAEDVDGEVCLVALLDNSNAFVKVADALMKLANEQGNLGMTKEVVNDDCTYYSCSPEENVSLEMAVAPESVVVRIKGSSTQDDKSLKDSMFALFTNGGPEKSEALDAFYASKGDMAMWMDFEGAINMAMPILKEMEPMAVAQLEAYMPMYKNASMVTDLEFKNGETVLKFQAFGSEEMKAYSKKYTTPASGKYLGEIPFVPVFAANVAIKDVAGMVKELSSMGEEFEEVFAYLEALGIDEEILAGFPGNITFALKAAGSEPGIILLTDCGENVWEYLQPVLAEYCDEPIPGTYAYENEICITYEDGTLKAADLNTFIANPYEFDYSESYLGQEIAEGGFVIDLNQLPTYMLSELVEELDMTTYEFLEFVDTVVLNYDIEKMSTTLTLNMGDTSQNFIGKLVQYFVEDLNPAELF